MLSSEVNTAEMDTIFTLYRRIIRVYSRYGGVGGRKMHRGQANRKRTCTISLLAASDGVICSVQAGYAAEQQQRP